ncbi:DUF305 domain-containing protein [Arthrobacter sp. GCM10027362]|uniref:DUF305 domain-containing protein n=1 Tax=Arthrobacter sp. GCM10027362 TaxID=3273379 RepID=UPI00362E90CE
MKRHTSLSATALAAALVLAGCGSAESGSSESSMPGMDHGATAQSPSAPASDTAAAHNSADAMFARMMIPHHQQAVQMSEIMLAKDGLDPQITRLAEQIKAAQAPEIETMTGWLKTWGDHSSMSGNHGMEGMMTEEDLAALEKAQGTKASKMFLTQMIAHHEGAITMAEEEVSNGSNPEAVALAKTIVKDQRAEIQKMKDLLAGL